MTMLGDPYVLRAHFFSTDPLFMDPLYLVEEECCQTSRRVHNRALSCSLEGIRGRRSNDMVVFDEVLDRNRSDGLRTSVLPRTHAPRSAL